MISVSNKDFQKALSELSIPSDALIYMHSGIANFGKLECTVGEIVDSIKEAFPQGTLLVPTYTNEFVKTGVFDVQNTKSEMGILSEHIRCMSESVVCPYSPLHPFAGIGKLAAELANTLRPKSSFDENSIFAEILRRDGYVMLFGCDFDALTFLHYLEEKLKVPYRCFMEFKGVVVDNGKETQWTTKYYARNKSFSVKDRFNEVGLEFSDTCSVAESAVGFGKIYLFKAKNVDKYFVPQIKKDPLYLLRGQDRRYYEFNPSAVAHPLYHFDHCVRRFTNDIAVKNDEAKLTFGELGRYSFHVADKLKPSRTNKSERVGVFMKKDPLYIAAMMGIWRSGFTYVPLDPSYPRNRLEYIINDAEIKTLITSGEEKNHGLNVEKTVVLDFDSPQCEPVREDVKYGLPTDLSYIIYTSGSTGNPKGVMITNDSFSKLIQWSCRYFSLQRNQKRILNIANFTFDQSMLDIAFMLGEGGQVYLSVSKVDPLKLLKIIEDEKIEILSTVPTTFGIIIEARKLAKKFDLSSIKTLITGGAVCPPSFIPQLKEMFPCSRIFNLYGPTEATVYCFEQRLDNIKIDENGQLPIGRPFDIMEAEILNEQNRTVNNAESGELALRGPLVMRGYWKLPYKNDNAFILDPARPDENLRIYRTGDIAYFSKGKYYLKGRKDSLIKSSGFRIDLNEIELSASKFPGCREVAAIIKPHPIKENTITLFYAGEVIEESTLRGHISNFLPEYMQPHKVIFMKSLPKSDSGKIDKKKLDELNTTAC